MGRDGSVSARSFVVFLLLLFAFACAAAQNTPPPMPSESGEPTGESPDLFDTNGQAISSTRPLKPDGPAPGSLSPDATESGPR